ncbi:aminodeoxychorismate synthase component I [Desulfobacula phenolica]|uniref:aminodeoxychorismate synthase n=1 Tax=Desulfobacula phenolica TaxID=90732 RepID=A0A1H2HG68_9BACT|nr:aminodeoxychorismate synthase component I [Desulfobacula phenolica]SDU30880.1 para-aminobenzoate synthetase component 1 [Desulfobacula phenolica]
MTGRKINCLNIDELLKQLPCLNDIHQETVQLDLPFEQIAESFADDKGTVLLLSGSSLDCSRYNILAAKPWLEVTSKQEKVFISCLGKESCVHQDPFSVVQALLNHFKLEDYSHDMPIHAGLFGYFSYDLKDRIEKLPRTCTDTGLPDLCLYAPSIILVQDKETGHARLCIPVPVNQTSVEKTDDIVLDTRRFFFEKIRHRVEREPFSIDNAGFCSSLTKPEYIRSVKRIIDYLRAGDIYQANFSQRFETGFYGDGYLLFLDLFERNPASFFSYIHAGDHKIVSTSPERFIKQNGRFVETRPIKGTIARGRTTKQDLENGSKLTRSIKDDAELTMIVDLMRNDLSRVTKHGSVAVTEHKRLEPYENVFHLVSVVEGELEEGKTSVDFLKATFPGGSITGCPKIRSMEIIDELESVKRHIYTGSIGYISFHDTMDLSIAIRTATIFNHKIFFSVGGGIVYDSDPEKEYQETLDKGKTLMEALSGTQKNVEDTKFKAKAWVDGKIIDQDKARISAVSPGFQYGAGLFETICVKQGTIFRLSDHVHRLNRAWENLFSETPPDITWKNVIDSLILANGFQDKVLAVKLLVSKDECECGKKLFLAAFARQYVHRLEMLDKKGLDLVTYPYPRQSPLADYKTLNYLYYDQAGRFAKARHADEAIVVNPDQTISETNTASILAIKDKTVIIPKSDHVLGGVTLKSVLGILSGKGYDICKTRIPKEHFDSYSNIILTNALMGAVKVLTIDGKKIEQEPGICSMINEQLFKLESNTHRRKKNRKESSLNLV